MKAHDLGYSQVLWLDGVERKYVEEVGSMNCFFKIDGVIRTAPCVGTVLPGITRMSCIELLEKWGYKVDCESRLPIADVIRAGKEGKLEEVFGTGTAAVISPVGELRYEDEVLTINGFQTGPVTQRLYDTLTGIQWGTRPTIWAGRRKWNNAGTEQNERAAGLFGPPRGCFTGETAHEEPLSLQYVFFVL